MADTAMPHDPPRRGQLFVSPSGVEYAVTGAPRTPMGVYRVYYTRRPGPMRRYSMSRSDWRDALRCGLSLKSTRKSTMSIFDRAAVLARVITRASRVAEQIELEVTDETGEDVTGRVSDALVRDAGFVEDMAALADEGVDTVRDKVEDLKAAADVIAERARAIVASRTGVAPGSDDPDPTVIRAGDE